MKSINIINGTDIRNLVVNELNKRDKLISKMQIDEHIKIGVTKHMTLLYKEIDKLRLRINDLENRSRVV